MQLIFIRHGKPEVVQGDRDPVLTKAARAEAERLANWLLREKIKRVVSSPLRRALQTAQPTSSLLGLELEVLDGLAEVGSSSLGYRGVEELQKDPLAWAKFMQDPISFLGADTKEFKGAVLNAVGSLFGDNTGDKIAVFSHGLPINVVLSKALGLDRVGHFLPDYCSLTRVTGSSLDDLTIVSVNETGHLNVIQ